MELYIEMKDGLTAVPDFLRNRVRLRNGQCLANVRDGSIFVLAMSKAVVCVIPYYHLLGGKQHLLTVKVAEMNEKDGMDFLRRFCCPVFGLSSLQKYKNVHRSWAENFLVPAITVFLHRLWGSRSRDEFGEVLRCVQRYLSELALIDESCRKVAVSYGLLVEKYCPSEYN